MSKKARSLVAATLLFAALMAAGCATPETKVPAVTPAAPAPGLLELLAEAHIVDLSHAYDAETVYWPTSPSKFELEELAYGQTEAGFFYAANSLSTPEHGGTHLDAPIHFSEGKWTTEAIPVERLMGPGVVIDVREQAAADREYRLTPEDLAAHEAAHGVVPEGAIVMLNTGWSAFWPDAEQYLGDATRGDASNLSFPSYGEAAARILVEERKAGALGVDTASIDYGPSTDFIVHQIANGANVPGLENVTDLDRLPATGSWIVALPMKIAGGSGGPARIVALIPRGDG